MINDQVSGKGNTWKKFVEEVMHDNLDAQMAVVKALAVFLEGVTNLKKLAACFEIIESLPEPTNNMSTLFFETED